MSVSRRAFIVGLAAAGAAMTAPMRSIPFASGGVVTNFDALVSFAFNQDYLEDARLVLPDTNRFRFLSDGD